MGEISRRQRNTPRPGNKTRNAKFNLTCLRYLSLLLPVIGIVVTVLCWEGRSVFTFVCLGLSILFFSSALYQENRYASRRERHGEFFFGMGCFFLLLSVIGTMVMACDKAKSTSLPPENQGIVEINLLQVNDVYEIAALDQGANGGMLKVATLKRKWEIENRNTLLLMAGDFLSPSVFNRMRENGNDVVGLPMIDAMNAAGVDLAIFGNHEFDIKGPQLNRCIDLSDFDWLASNVLTNQGTPFMKHNKPIPDFVIREFTGKTGTVARLGFIGITTPTRSDYAKFDSSQARIKILFDQLNASCDAVFAITHQSIEEDSILATRMPSLAAIIGGHEHDKREITVNNVLITKAHSNARSAFRLKVIVDKGRKRKSVEATLIMLDSTVTEDALMQPLIRKWTEKALNYYRDSGYSIAATVYTGVPLDGRDVSIRADSQNNLAQHIVRAMERACPAADLAVFNSGSVRVDELMNSPVTQYDILRALPFGGKILEVEMSGEMITKMLDIGISNSGTGGFLHYSHKLEKGSSGWSIGGAKIVSLKPYRVAISEFLTTGKEKNLPFLSSVKKLHSDTSFRMERADISLALIKYF